MSTIREGIDFALQVVDVIAAIPGLPPGIVTGLRLGSTWIRMSVELFEAGGTPAAELADALERLRGERARADVAAIEAHERDQIAALRRAEAAAKASPNAPEDPYEDEEPPP